MPEWEWNRDFVSNDTALTGCLLITHSPLTGSETVLATMKTGASACIGGCGILQVLGCDPRRQQQASLGVP